MSIKPNSLPRWASTDVVNGVTGQNNVIEPSSAKKDLGWDYLEKPARNYMNWAQRISYLNLEYLINEVDQFAPHESDPQAMTVTVDSGRIFSNGTVTTKSVQTTSTITAPSGNPRIDRIVIDESTGVISIIAGVESASPVPTTIPNGKRPICQVLLDNSPATTVITDDLITDERSAALVTGILSENETVTGLWSFNNGLTQFGSSAPGDGWTLDALEISSTGSIMSGLGLLNLSENAYYDGSWKYQNTDAASRIAVGDGIIQLNAVASGTADATISWTEVARAGLSANGAEVLSVGKNSFEAWASGYVPIQLNATSAVLAAAGSFFMVENGYYDGAWKYTSTSHATRLTSGAGNHRWDSAPSGTADTAITFIETMRTGLSASGAEVLSIGKASFENWSDTYSVVQVGGNGALWCEQAEGVNKILITSQNVYFDGSSRYVSTDEASYTVQSNGEHQWFSAGSGTAGAAISWTETMRTGLSANGTEVLSIGKGSFEAWHANYSAFQLGGNMNIMSLQAESAAWDFYINGNALFDGTWKYISTDEASQYNQTAGEHIWRTAASGITDTAISWTEVMRTDANGDLFIGKTSDLLSVDGHKFFGAGYSYHTTTSGVVKYLNRTGTDGQIVQFQNSDVYVGDIDVTGVVTSYNSVSDYRLKENEVPLINATERLKLLKPYRLNFIGETKTIDSWFAHEVAEVVPEAVSGEKDAADEDGNPEMQSMDASKLIPLMVASMQEMLTKIETLENR